MSHDRVNEILSWYDHENRGVRSNLARMFMHGRLAGTGKLVILPVDQGFEHGPTRSFSVQPSGFDPRYHARLAIAAGCSAYAAPPGALADAGLDLTAGLPLILKVNSSDGLYQDADPQPAVTASVDDALRLGCCAVGFTIYPGSAARITMFEQLRSLAADARAAGLGVVVWAYPRGSGLSEAGQTAVDVVAYSAHIAAQLGAHIIKVKPPTSHVEFDSNRTSLSKAGVDISSLAARVSHVVRSAFDGRRVVIFSGGPAKEREDVLEENRQTAAGGGFGAIVGRNSFQRPWSDAIRLLHDIMDIHERAAAPLDLRVPM
ncbi:MAG: class I fructose-bisphosphate aldolase [Actinobacteria bacterium]|nr:class I fructose-bisphosphate aldolase [Actinomycetota bacterium]